MATYTVRLEQYIQECAFVEVEADSAEEAAEMALAANDAYFEADSFVSGPRVYSVSTGSELDDNIEEILNLGDATDCNFDLLNGCLTQHSDALNEAEGRFNAEEEAQEIEESLPPGKPAKGKRAIF